MKGEALAIWKYRLAYLATKEADAIRASYAWPPRPPLSPEEKAAAKELDELSDRAARDATREAGVAGDPDAEDRLWRKALDW